MTDELIVQDTNAQDTSFVFQGGENEPIITIKPEGIVEVKGDYYEAAILFWEAVQNVTNGQFRVVKLGAPSND